MNCRTAAKYLGPYADGELSQAERAPLDLHLRDCPACREEVRTIRALDRAAAGIDAPPVSERQWQETWDGVQTGIRSTLPAVFLSRPFAWAPLAAAALIVAGIVAYLYYSRTPVKGPDGLAGGTAPPREAPAFLAGLSEVRFVEGSSPDYIPSTFVADDGTTVVWIAGIRPGI